MDVETRDDLNHSLYGVLQWFSGRADWLYVSGHSTPEIATYASECVSAEAIRRGELGKFVSQAPISWPPIESANVYFSGVMRRAHGRAREIYDAFRAYMMPLGFSEHRSVRRRHREPQAETAFRSSCNYEAWEICTAQLTVALKPNSGTSGRRVKNRFRQRYTETSPQEEVLSKCLRFIVLAAPSSCWTDITYPQMR
jgi:hypothetical protein